jgi:ubiquinone/menaquinone biosynthesis C-methylase UbiE
MPKTGPFDKNASRYEKWFREHANVLRSELEAIRSVLPEPGLAVEIGVGTGVFASQLNVGYGVEPSMSMARYASIRDIEVALGVAEQLPLKSNTFDTVLVVATLCFVDDVVMTVREAYRVLKPQGSAVVAIIDRQSALGRAYMEKKSESTFYAEAKFLSVQELTWYLKEAGFAEFAFAQSIFESPEEMDRVESPTEGYGLGSFVVVRALKEPAQI